MLHAQPVLVGLTCARGLEQMTSRGPIQPQPVCDFVNLRHRQMYFADSPLWPAQIS